MTTFNCNICCSIFPSKRSLTSHMNFHKEGYAEKHRKASRENYQKARTQRTIKCSVLYEQNETQYNQNPIMCKQCSAYIAYKDRFNKKTFCSRSCSAIFHNSKRLMANGAKSTATFNTPKHIPCEQCSAQFITQFGKRFCSSTCYKAHVKIKRRSYTRSEYSNSHAKYRMRCIFTFTKDQYPHLFKDDLIEKFGWYRAANHPLGYNPEGVTWDHLFRIEDGRRLGVDPKIMSHPANAEMVTWKDNFKRRKSVITLEDLLDRIKKWTISESHRSD